MILNTLGTKRVLELCEEMKNLKSFVHVSTAYSNSDKETIEETVYAPPHNPNAVISSIDILPQEGIDILSKKLLVSRALYIIIRNNLLDDKLFRFIDYS